jgi:hypothetical protein
MVLKKALYGKSIGVVCRFRDMEIIDKHILECIQPRRAVVRIRIAVASVTVDPSANSLCSSATEPAGFDDLVSHLN